MWRLSIKAPLLESSDLLSSIGLPASACAPHNKNGGHSMVAAIAAQQVVSVAAMLSRAGRHFTQAFGGCTVALSWGAVISILNARRASHRRARTPASRISSPRHPITTNLNAYLLRTAPGERNRHQISAPRAEYYYCCCHPRSLCPR